MVGIVIDDDASTMRGYVKNQHMDWPVGIDPNGAASLSFGTTGQPETYVIAPDGVAVCGSARRVDAGRPRRLAPGRARRARVHTRQEVT